MAMEFRQRYHKDVVIDLYCYRRYGHNEGDEPRFTQPKMYELISARKTVRALYAEELAGKGRLDAGASKALYDEVNQQYLDAFAKSKTQSLVKDLFAAPRAGQEVDVNVFANEVVAVQTAEIGAMRQLLAQLPEK